MKNHLELELELFRIRIVRMEFLELETLEIF